MTESLDSPSPNQTLPLLISYAAAQLRVNITDHSRKKRNSRRIVKSTLIERRLSLYWHLASKVKSLRKAQITFVSSRVLSSLKPR